MSNKPVTSTSTASAPPGVHLARCIAELRADRGAVRAVRQLIEQSKIELSQELKDAAATMETIAGVVEIASKMPIGEAAELGAKTQDECSKHLLGGLQKHLEQGFEALRQQAAELSQPNSGDDFFSQNSSEVSQRLAELKRGAGKHR
jgi:hypothetical protein